MGALSNFEQLNALKKQILAQPQVEGEPAPTRLRSGVVQAAVIQVLADAGQAMSVPEVVAVVEERLGMSVSRDTVNSCLSTGAQFVRVGRGMYRFRII